MIDDETLTLYFYNEGLTAEQRLEIDSALDGDTELAASYTALRHDLEQLQDSMPVSAPSHYKAQWHDAIERAAQLERGKSVIPQDSWWRFAWGGLVAAGLVAAFVIGTQFRDVSNDSAPMLVNRSATTGDTAQVAFTRGLQVHLQTASTDIQQSGERSMDDQATLIHQIVAQNRMFEHAAEVKNAPDVARFMRALEPVLLKLSDNNLTPVEADILRMQLSFELNAVLTKIEHSTSEVTDII